MVIHVGGSLFPSFLSEKEGWNGEDNKMTRNQIKKLAHSYNMECIFKGNEVCIRPMHFDDDGIRIVRYYPSSYEFVTKEEAELLLKLKTLLLS